MSRLCWECAVTTRQPLTRQWPPRERSKGKGITLSPLPKFLSTASLLYNVPTKCFDFGQWGGQVVMSLSVRSLTVTISLVPCFYVFFGAVRLLFGGNGKDGSSMGVVRWQERI